MAFERDVNREHLNSWDYIRFVPVIWASKKYRACLYLD